MAGFEGMDIGGALLRPCVCAEGIEGSGGAEVVVGDSCGIIDGIPSFEPVLEATFGAGASPCGVITIPGGMTFLALFRASACFDCVVGATACITGLAPGAMGMPPLIECGCAFPEGCFIPRCIVGNTGCCAESGGAAWDCPPGEGPNPDPWTLGGMSLD